MSPKAEYKPSQPSKRSTRSYTRKTGIFFFQLIVGLLFLVAVGWWGYTQVLKYILGRYDFFNIQPAISTIYGAPQVLLVNPVRTEEFLRREPADTTWPYLHRHDPWKLADTLWYAPPRERHKGSEIEAWQLISYVKEREIGLANYWQDILTNSKINYKMIEEPGITDIPIKYNILILPGTLLLSAEERRAIKDFIADGGNVLACWYAGCRDENGDWLGSRFLSRLVGGLDAKQVVDSAGSTSFILRGNNPLTAMIAPGTHLEFFTYNGYITVNLIEPRSFSDAWWFDPYWRDRNNTSTRNNCIAAHGTYVKGRFVWLGFAPESVMSIDDNPEIMKKLVTNAIWWLHGRPVVNARVWPLGYSAGGSILLEARGSGKLVQRILERTKETGINLDLIIEEDNIPEGITFQDLSMGDLVLSCKDSKQVTEYEIEEQQKWMKERSRNISRLTGKSPVGLYPKNWVIGKDTKVAAIRSGFQYIFSDTIPRDYGAKVKLIAPVWWKWIFMGKRPLASIPKSQISLWEWNKLKGIRGADNLLNAMTDDMTRIRNAGGMYMGILDPTVLDKENSLDMPQKMVALMDTLGIWRANTKTLMDRFGGWRGLRVSSKSITSERVRLSLSNEGKFKMKNVVYDVHLPNGISEVKVTTHIVGFKVSDVSWNNIMGRCTFIIPEIGPRDNVVIFIDFIRFPMDKMVGYPVATQD